MTCFFVDFTTTKKLIWSLFRITIILFTLIWHIVLFLLTAPLLLEHPALFIRSLHFTLLLTVALIFFIWFSYQRNRCINAHRTIQKGFHSYGNEGDKITAILVKNFRKTYIISLSVLPILIGSSAIFVFFASTIDEMTGSPPRDDPENGVDINLPIPLWYPWDIERWHYFQVLLQLFVALITGILIINADLIFVNLAYTVSIQLELLLISLEKIEKRSLRKYKQLYPADRPIIDYNDPKFMKSYEDCLRKNVEQHQHLFSFFEVINPLGNLPIFCAFGVGAMVIGMSGVDILTGGARIGDMILNVMLCFAELGNMAVLCWYGQRVTDLSSEVHDAIYNTKWYLCSRQITTMIKIVQCRTVKPMVVSAGIWTCDLVTFQAVMNASYSYLNLIMASRES